MVLWFCVPISGGNKVNKEGTSRPCPNIVKHCQTSLTCLVQENSDTSSDGSITTSDIEYKEECGNYSNSGQESSTNNSSKSNPRSMDSGIATRSQLYL